MNELTDEQLLAIFKAAQRENDTAALRAVYQAGINDATTYLVSTFNPASA